MNDQPMAEDYAIPKVIEVDTAYTQRVINTDKDVEIAKEEVRTFDTGARRGTDNGKLDFDGFLSPLALEAFAVYLHFHRELPDGTMRSSDNWQKGIPIVEYRKSLWRHFFDSWKALRGYSIKENLIWALCGLMFNTQGILHELLKVDPNLLTRELTNELNKRKSIRLKGK